MFSIHNDGISIMHRTHPYFYIFPTYMCKKIHFSPSLRIHYLDTFDMRPNTYKNEYTTRLIFIIIYKSKNTPGEWKIMCIFM